MKNFFSACGKAIGYLSIFFLSQIIVSVVVEVIVSVSFFQHYTISNFTDTYQMQDLLIKEVYKYLGLISVISGLITLAVILLIIKSRKKKLRIELSIAKFNPLGLIPILIGGVALQYFITIAMDFIPIPDWLMDDYINNVANNVSQNEFFMIIGVTIMAPIVEEVILRGLVFTRFAKGMPTTVALILSSLVFGIMHGQIIQIVYASVLGVILCLLFIKYRSILANIALHFAFNTSSYLMSITEINDATTEWIIFGASALVIAGCVFAIIKFVKPANNTETVIARVCTGEYRKEANIMRPPYGMPYAQYGYSINPNMVPPYPPQNYNFPVQNGYNQPQQNPYVQNGYIQPQQNPYAQNGYNQPQQNPYAQNGYNQPQQNPYTQNGYNQPQQNPYAQNGYNKPQQNPYVQNGYNQPQQNPYVQNGYNQPQQNPYVQNGYSQPQQNPYVQNGYNQSQQNPYAQNGYNQPQQNPYVQNGYNHPQKNPYVQNGYNQPPQNPNVQEKSTTTENSDNQQ